MTQRLIAACKAAIQKIESGAHFDWYVRDAMVAELKAAVSEAEQASVSSEDLDFRTHD